MEWGYTYNMFNIKDKQFDNVVTVMESWKKNFATQESLHNALTKTGVNLRIITDDKAKLLLTYAQHTDSDKPHFRTGRYP